MVGVIVGLITPPSQSLSLEISLLSNRDGLLGGRKDDGRVGMGESRRIYEMTG